jgi:hypothetical protein
LGRHADASAVAVTERALRAAAAVAASLCVLLACTADGGRSGGANDGGLDAEATPPPPTPAGDAGRGALWNACNADGDCQSGVCCLSGQQCGGPVGDTGDGGGGGDGGGDSDGGGGAGGDSDGGGGAGNDYCTMRCDASADCPTRESGGAPFCNGEGLCVR